ncbi:hypothetical protein Vafri_22262, partial [Volvox africanus]
NYVAVVPFIVPAGVLLIPLWELATGVGIRGERCTTVIQCGTLQQELVWQEGVRPSQVWDLGSRVKCVCREGLEAARGSSRPSPTPFPPHTLPPPPFLAQRHHHLHPHASSALLPRTPPSGRGRELQ